MRRAEESLQDLWPFGIELPHTERPALAGEDPAEKHHLNNVSETGVLFYHIFAELLQQHHFVGRPPVQTLVGPRRKLQRGSGSESRSGHTLGSARFGDVEPLLLPYLNSLHEGPFGPGDVGELAHHGTAVVHVLPVDHLQLHVEKLEP